MTKREMVKKIGALEYDANHDPHDVYYLGCFACRNYGGYRQRIEMLEANLRLLVDHLGVEFKFIDTAPAHYEIVKKKAGKNV